MLYFVAVDVFDGNARVILCSVTMVSTSYLSLFKALNLLACVLLLLEEAGNKERNP